MVQLNWPRISHKISKIGCRMLHSEQNLQVRFNDLVHRWETHHSETKDATNLKARFAQLLALITNLPSLDEGARFRRFMDVKKACLFLDASEFFHTALERNRHDRDVDPWVTELSPSDKHFILKLRRRFRNLCVYSTGAEKYISVIREYIRKRGTQTDLASMVKFKWIGNTEFKDAVASRTLIWPESSLQWILGEVKNSDQVGIKEHADSLARKDINTPFSTLWSADTKFTGRVHSITALVYYLNEKDIEVEYSAIGSSAQICTACKAFVAEVRPGFRGERWNTIGSSGKSRGGWIMPYRENSRIVPEWWNHVFNYVWERVKEHSEIVIEAELDGWPENNFL